ncbi:MAG: tRNA-specific adenosine deaminase [Moraxellaceae bacterium]|nr:tRNA-specific adenosine deaminase [Moraxellaceae bacterium]
MQLSLSLPDWLLPAGELIFGDDVAAMAHAVALSRRNVQEGGGPFAALVLDAQGRVIAAGVNRVTEQRNSVLHAEMVALMLAQRQLRTHDLGSIGRCTLVTTCAPCAMCLGAIPWSGVSRVVCGARSEDAEAIGFDEGDKAVDWAAGLRRRGIDVAADVERDAALEVLRHYAAQGHPLY